VVQLGDLVAEDRGDLVWLADGPIGVEEPFAELVERGATMEDETYLAPQYRVGRWHGGATVAERWKSVTGKPSYGLTETSPATVGNLMTIEDYTRAIGVPIPSTDIAIRDADGRDLPLGEAGELCINGPQVMAGYWNKPEETAHAMTEDGFLRTGDIARIDERGYV
jgi:acyl-CoA synthetase (AMP-forming)/AMP-acid ligase II